MRAFACAAALAASALSSPASAAELEDALIAIHAALAGSWAGTVAAVDPETGERSEEADSFAFAVTSEDGLDSTMWNAGFVEWAEYRQDGVYSIRFWNAEGHSNAVSIRFAVLEGPDESGNAVWIMDGEPEMSDGTLRESRETFTLRDNVLTMEGGLRPVGSDEPFSSLVRGTWTRQ